MATTVAELPSELDFVSDSQDVAAIKESLSLDDEYDSFFIRTGEGEYLEIWGMVGIIPYNHKSVRKVL